MASSVIAIDGQAYVGKSTIARCLAELTGTIYINTGHMYRAVALGCLQENCLPGDEARVLAVASELGIDVERLKADMQDPAIAAAIARNLDLAQALRITGTPGFVIGEQVFRGAAETATLNSLIKRARIRGANGG